MEANLRLELLPDHVFGIIALHLDIGSFGRFLQVSKGIYKEVTANHEYFTKQALWRELGLSQVTMADDLDETLKSSPYLSTSFCKQVYSAL
jgi:PHP family Zn ribbon phosphoesterase